MTDVISVTTEKLVSPGNTSELVADYYYYDYVDVFFSSLEKYAPVFVIASLGVVANSAGLLLFWKFPELTRRNPLVKNQTIIDLIGSAILLMTYGIYIEKDGRMDPNSRVDQFLCRFIINEFLFWCMSNCSTFNLTAIALERFVMVVFPIHHRRYNKYRYNCALILTVWLSPLLTNLPNPMISYAGTGGWCGYDNWRTRGLEVSYTVVYAVVTFLLPLLVLVVTYAMIIHTLVKRNRRIVPVDVTGSVLRETGSGSTHPGSGTAVVHVPGEGPSSERGAPGQASTAATREVGTAPAREGGTAPAREGGTAPAREGCTAPAREVGTAPTREGCTAPAREVGTAPARDTGRETSKAPVRETTTTTALSKEQEREKIAASRVDDGEKTDLPSGSKEEEAMPERETGERRTTEVGAAQKESGKTGESGTKVTGTGRGGPGEGGTSETGDKPTMTNGRCQQPGQPENMNRSALNKKISTTTTPARDGSGHLYVINPAPLVLSAEKLRNMPHIMPDPQTEPGTGDLGRTTGGRKGRGSRRHFGPALSRAQLTMTNTMLAVTGVYLVCLLPYQLWWLMHILVAIEYDESTYVWMVALTVLNNCLNPFIYAIKVKIDRSKRKIRKVMVAPVTR